jgi:hypothetical protein
MSNPGTSSQRRQPASYTCCSTDQLCKACIHSRRLCITNARMSDIVGACGLGHCHPGWVGFRPPGMLRLKSRDHMIRGRNGSAAQKPALPDRQRCCWGELCLLAATWSRAWVTWVNTGPASLSLGLVRQLPRRVLLCSAQEGALGLAHSHRHVPTGTSKLMHDRPRAQSPHTRVQHKP